MSDKQPIIIQRGSFVCTIYDIGNLMELPLANLRKIWKIMLSAPIENEATIEQIRTWLPTNTTNSEKVIHAQQSLLKQAVQELETLRSSVAAFGSVATKEQKADLISARRKAKAAEKALKTAKAYHAKAQKLQSIFTEMTQK